MTDYLGWTATAVFVGSYFCAGSAALKRMQMAGALIWMAYGLLIGASPVVAANLLVFAAAGWSTRGARDEALNPNPNPGTPEPRHPGT